MSGRVFACKLSALSPLHCICARILRACAVGGCGCAAEAVWTDSCIS